MSSITFHYSSRKNWAVNAASIKSANMENVFVSPNFLFMCANKRKEFYWQNKAIISRTQWNKTGVLSQQKRQRRQWICNGLGFPLKCRKFVEGRNFTSSAQKYSPWNCCCSHAHRYSTIKSHMLHDELHKLHQLTKLLQSRTIFQHRWASKEKISHY